MTSFLPRNRKRLRLLSSGKALEERKGGFKSWLAEEGARECDDDAVSFSVREAQKGCASNRYCWGRTTAVLETGNCTRETHSMDQTSNKSRHKCNCTNTWPACLAIGSSHYRYCCIFHINVRTKQVMRKAWYGSPHSLSPLSHRGSRWTDLPTPKSGGCAPRQR